MQQQHSWQSLHKHLSGRLRSCAERKARLVLCRHINPLRSILLRCQLSLGALLLLPHPQDKPHIESAKIYNNHDSNPNSDPDPRRQREAEGHTMPGRLRNARECSQWADSNQINGTNNTYIIGEHIMDEQECRVCTCGA